MPAAASLVQVRSEQELEMAVTSYVANGFVVSHRTDDAVFMYKRKEFNVLWAIVGLVLCLLPLLIYLIVYATQRDQLVEIRLSGTSRAVPSPPGAVLAPPSSAAAAPEMSPDRRWWWDGGQWRDAEAEAPPSAQRSDDGFYWWDGTAWRLLPAADSERPI